MILHDLRCTKCAYEKRDVYVEAGRYGECPKCAAPLTWMPFEFATDVRGSEQVTETLCEPYDPKQPLRWTSSRERDRKMLQQGMIPAGDRHHGALGNSDPAKGRIYSQSVKPSVARQKRKTHVRSASASRA